TVVMLASMIRNTIIRSIPGISRMLLILCLLLVPFILQAQPGDSPRPGDRLDKSVLGEQETDPFQKELMSTVFPIERSIDPTSYRLGPTDQVLISASILTQGFPTTVSIDNSVVLPRGLGVLSVEGKTLA